MLFDASDLFKSFNNDLNIFDLFQDKKNESKVELYSVEEGFLRGNMFKNLYDPYKNYSPYKVEFTSEKEKLLFDVQKYDFAINDLNLYLDLCPNDEYVFNLFKQYVMEYEKAKKEYVCKYGPLLLTDDLGIKYDWNKNPWPWDKEGRDYYV